MLISFSEHCLLYFASHILLCGTSIYVLTFFFFSKKSMFLDVNTDY